MKVNNLIIWPLYLRGKAFMRQESERIVMKIKITIFQPGIEPCGP